MQRLLTFTTSFEWWGKCTRLHKKLLRKSPFFFLHCWLSAVSARSKWIRCGCRRAHKSYKHWGNVFQTCLPGVICQEWVTLFYTERAPFHLSGVLLPIGLNVQCGITTSGHGRDVIETKTRQSRLFFCIFSCDKLLLFCFFCLFGVVFCILTIRFCR